MVAAVAAPSIREQLVESVGNSARTVTDICNVTGLTKSQVNANIYHLKNDGTVVTTADGFTLRAGHKMPVKVTKPKPGEVDPQFPKPTAAPRTNGAAAKVPEGRTEAPNAAAPAFQPDPLIVANLGEYVVIRKSDLRELVGAVEIVGRWRELVDV